MAEKYFIDTCSLIDLLKKCPTAKNKKLYNKIQAAFESRQCVLLESVLEELKTNGPDQIAVLEELNFLKKDEGKFKPQKNIDNIPEKIREKISLDWIDEKRKNQLYNEGLTEKKIDIRIRQMIGDSADLQLILAAMEYSGLFDASEDGGMFPDLKNDDVGIVITEENRKRDGKMFKKIPQITDTEGIECISIFKMLEQLGIEIQYTTK